MARGKMRLAKQHHYGCGRMTSSNLRDLFGRVPVARSDFPQIFPRHAVERVQGLAVLPRHYQQVVKGRPIVSPLAVEADAGPQLLGADLAAPPFVEYVLVARENRLQSQDQWPLPRQRTHLEERSGVPLGAGKGMIVADQDDLWLP